MFCRPASSRAHVTLIQSLSFNFKSLVDFRNPHWVHWKSPALLFSSLLLVSPPFCLFLFFIPPFIFYVISLFLPLISSRHNLRVVCGSYHSVAPSACRSIRPSARFLFRRHSWCIWGVSMTDQSFVVLVKIPADLTGENTNPWCRNDVFARCGFDIFSWMSNQIYSLGIFFTESVLQIFVFLLVTGDKKQWKNGERNTKGGEEKKEALKEKSERDTDGGFWRGGHRSSCIQSS